MLYAFSGFTFDPAERLLTKDGIRASITPKAAGVLEALLSRHGKTVTKEELLQEVWPDTHVEESTLSQNVSTLRRLLGSPSAIEAVTRAGYRFTLPVEVVHPTGPGPGFEEASDLAAPPAKASFSRRKAAAALVAVVLVGAAGSMYAPRWSRQRAADRLVDEGFRVLRELNASTSDKAAQLFLEALDRSPDYPRAQAGMAEVYARRPLPSYEHAKKLAQASVNSDPGCAECRGSLGLVLMARFWDWPGAYRELRAAVDLAPDKAQLHLWLSLWYATQRRLKEAHEEAALAVKLAPAGAGPRANLSQMLYFQTRYKEALAEAETAIGLSAGGASGYHWRYRCHCMLGMDMEAAAARAEEISVFMDSADEGRVKLTGDLNDAFLAKGRAGLAAHFLALVSGEAVNRIRDDRALLQMWAGNHQGALDELELGSHSHPFGLMYAAVEPAFIPLHSEPRFRRALEAMKLPLPPLN